jgi:2-oxoglutarate ferredoxin oxidoreductase subunit alpha
VAIGVILGILGIPRQIYRDYFAQRFGSKSQDVVDKNIDAGNRGYAKGRELVDSEVITVDIAPDESVKNELLINGSTAVTIGALAGGCNFVSSYPMSASTGVLIGCAGYSHEFDIVVEQAEDEIAAVNMACGAWYAGARALVTTSGGGFALMGEGISLAGMIESPLVIHLAQRPGPATGLPTRTEQGDLELALYAGHGEFPRVLYAPGTLSQAIHCMHRAFTIADTYQIPVIVLTDQYLVDSYATTSQIDLSDVKIDNAIIETDDGYRRFAVTENGISPRGIPGLGKGIVCVDSDEHTEEGYITESMEMRNAMVEKRNAKLAALTQESIAPELIGGDTYRILVVCWGSNYHAVCEAVELLNRDDCSVLHFSQLYPVPPQTREVLERAETIVMVENNATSQFARLIKQSIGIEITKHIRKYSGLPSSVEEIRDELKTMIE